MDRYNLDASHYRPAPPPKASADVVASHEQRQANRKKQRVQYFKNNTSVRRGSPAVIAAMQQDLKQRLAPGRALGQRVFDSRGGALRVESR